MNKSIVFSLAEIFFGIPINQIKRLGKPENIEPLKGAPDWIGGFMSYRDSMLPYITFWNILKIHPPSKEFLLLPSNFDYCAFGISKINGIFEIEIKEKNSNIFKIPYIMGFGEFHERVVIFIDLNNFLSPEQKNIVGNFYKKNE
jgi:chemotaxis signal transduction protein